MPKRCDALNSNGGPVLPVSDAAPFYTDIMGPQEGQNCIVYIEFFSEDAGLVPASGTPGTVGCVIFQEFL